MKTSCSVIKDLLPLYHDGVCSDESKALVEEHLADCKLCKDELQAMDNKLPIISTEHNLNQATAVKELSIKWKKGMFNSLLKGVIVTIAIVALLFLLLYSFIGFRIII
jgi:predicted anti-sigma-YlaC factor YlaD